MNGKERAIGAFKEKFGCEPTMLSSSPARVNVIGEHTDYNDGFVMPMAINMRLWVAFNPRDDEVVRVFSVEMAQMDEFGLKEALSMVRSSDAQWGNYIRGVAWALMSDGISPCGMDACIASDIPIGAGLSSSAAIETAVATAMLYEQFKFVDKTRIAKLCQRAENEFVGVRCGIMDQMICMHGRRGHALLLDCRHLSFEHVPISHPKYAFIVADTAKERALATSEYNIRRQQCEEGVKLLSRLLQREIRALRDVSYEEFKTVEHMLPDVIRRRCRHVITENERVHGFREAFLSGDIAKAGELMNESHESLKEDYEVSCFELDVMVELLRSHKGVIGARLTGAGFGGCVIALSLKEALDEILSSVPQMYANATGLTPTLNVCEPSEGATLEEI
jgi:galactokinase